VCETRSGGERYKKRSPDALGEEEEDAKYIAIRFNALSVQVILQT